MSPAAHPGTAGRADELADLARSVRRLVAATVLNRAPAGDLRAFARELDAVAVRLEAHVPDPHRTSRRPAGRGRSTTA